MNKRQELIVKMIKEAKKGFDLYKEPFEFLEKGYMNILDPQKEEELKKRKKSIILPKIIRAKVRRVVISVMKTYFDNDEFAKLVPIFEDFEDTQKLQKVLDHWLNRRMNLYSRIKPSIYDACIYGTCCVKVYWSDTLKVQRIKIKDVYIDPNAESIFDIQYVVNRIYTTIGKLKKQFGNRKFFKDYAGEYEGDNKISNEFVGDATRILVYDVYRIKDGQWTVSTLLPDYKFLRTDESLKDGLPFVFGVIDPQFVPINNKGVVEAYGDSFIEPMIPLQEEYTVLRNQQINAVDKQLNQQFLATKMSGLKEADLNSNKKKIEVSDLNAVKEIPKPNINQSTFVTDRLDNEMQEVSGITKFTQGLPNSAAQTATGMTILTQESNEIVADIVRSLNESLFEPLISRIVRLIYKYDANPLLYGVDRTKDIKFKVSINAGVGATNKEVMINNITTAEQTAMQMVNIAAQLQDLETAKKYLQVLNELFKQKMSAMELKNIIPILGGENGRREPNASDGGATPQGAAIEYPAGEAEQSLASLPAGIEGEIRQPLPSSDGQL